MVPAHTTCCKGTVVAGGELSSGCQVESVDTTLHPRPIHQRPYHYSVFYEQREHRLTFPTVITIRIPVQSTAIDG
jgi:hypothetical protein